MKRYLMSFMVAGLLVCLLVQPVEAYHWKGLEITPRVELMETYDSNITNASNDPLNDIRTDATLGLGLWREGKTSYLKLGTTLTRQMFMDNTAFDNTVLSFNGLYSINLSKHDQLSFEDSFSRSEELEAFDQEFGTTKGRYIRNVNNFFTNYRHEASDKLALRANFRNIMSNYPADIQADSISNTLGTGVDYSFSSADIVSVDYKYQTHEFQPGASAEVNEFASNYRHFLTPRLYADLSTGVDLINDFNGDSKAYPLYHAALTQDTDVNTRISLSLDQRHELTSNTADVFSNWRLSGNIVKQLMARLQGILTIFYGEGKYVTSGDTNSLAGIDAGINYELVKNASLRLGYRFATSNTLNGTGDYDKSRVYCGFVFKF